ncbi:hypothetical protein ACVMIX_006244 [Rhizobium leguminosarum]
MTPSVATKPDESERLRELAGERYRNDQRLGGSLE